MQSANGEAMIFTPHLAFRTNDWGLNDFGEAAWDWHDIKKFNILIVTCGACETRFSSTDGKQSAQSQLLQSHRPASELQ
jgi:hypothetical protein